MDLIEQFGGYEKAKQKYSERPFDLAWGDIKKALLEHRRQHNTYEAGDHVVLINKPSSSNSLHRVLDVNEPTTIHICPINQVSGNDLVLLGFMASPFYLRHATDAEIEMGKRVQQYEALPESVRQSLMEVS